MARDKNGVSVEYGDWIAAGSRIAQVTEIKGTREGSIFRAAYIDWSDKRAKIRYVSGSSDGCILLMRADGTLAAAATALPLKGTVG